MTDNGDKLPVGIVTTVINKIADFTKETEILRSQIPTRESIDALNNKVNEVTTKVDKASSRISYFFGVVAIIVALSFLGAQLIDWSRKDSISNKQVIEEIKKDVGDQFKKDIQEILKNRDKDIIKEINELHKNDNKDIQDGNGH